MYAALIALGAFAFAFFVAQAVEQQLAVRRRRAVARHAARRWGR